MFRWEAEGKVDDVPKVRKSVVGHENQNHELVTSYFPLNHSLQTPQLPKKKKKVIQMRDHNSEVYFLLMDLQNTVVLNCPVCGGLARILSA